MGLDHINVCETGLALGLGFKPEVTPARAADIHTYPSARLKAMSFEASLTLGLVSDENKDKVCIISYSKKQSSSSGDQLLYRQDSGASSFSNNVSVKREREQMESGDTETPPPPRVLRSRVISDPELDDDDGDGSSIGRKKLRLTKAQSALLEESFKQHTTLNPKQKQELARELNLRPRQVEVWFQNRRARRKLKQTEVDCEYLKKWCESLRDENRRLEQEVEALKVAHPLYMQLPAATLTMCPSCERVGRPVAGDIIITSSNTPPLTSSNSHFYNSFPNNPSSAPCN